MNNPTKREAAKLIGVNSLNINNKDIETIQFPTELQGLFHVIKQ
jgi:hypothetical protein